MSRSISPYVHVCYIKSGSLAGNKLIVEVDSWDFEVDGRCDNCGEPLVTAKQLVAHIYRELTE